MKRSRSAYDLVDYLIAYIIWAEWRGFHGTAAMAILAWYRDHPEKFAERYGGRR